MHFIIPIIRCILLLIVYYVLYKDEQTWWPVGAGFALLMYTMLEGVQIG